MLIVRGRFSSCHFGHLQLVAKKLAACSGHRRVERKAVV
jgi:nicotinamide mononucleotide adenylyltransferase